MPVSKINIVKSFRYKFDRDMSVVNWASKVIYLLQNLGFIDVWLFPESVNVNVFVKILRVRLLDIYISQWRQDVRNKTSLSLFREIKVNFETSDYLIKMHCSKLRNIIAKLRMSSHHW